MIGNYNSTRISAAAKHSLERLLAWKLDLSHVDPLSTLTWQSTGNPRFPRGAPVFLRAISAHRDTYFTDCPGNALYAELPQIAHDVARIGLPKLYAPAVKGKLGGDVTFSGRLSGAVPWTVTVTNSAGTQVAQGSGTGPSLSWTWNSAAAPPDRYTWTIAGPASLLGATGTIGDEGDGARVPQDDRGAGPDQPRRRSERRHGDDLVHADAGRHGDRDARGRDRRDDGDGRSSA